MSSDKTTGLLHRVKPRASAIIRFTIDGRAAEARAGDTLLTAMLLNGERLREFEFGEGDRAGFCLMGACQDCWVRLEGGGRVRACSTLVADGMAIVTEGPRHV
jgi:predicted molibdopterin-dependent oxidoreductase YjgC